MKRILLFLILVQVSLVQFGQIIADHTVIDKYDDIPQYYIDEVKKMLVEFLGESHSSAYRSGLHSLEAVNSKYQVQEFNPPSGYTTSYLRISGMPWGDVGHETGWMMSYGEEDWFTSELAITRTKAGITYVNTNIGTISAIGFAWCYDGAQIDMTAYLSATQEYIDYCIANGYSTKVIFTTGPVDGANATGELGYNKHLAYKSIRDYVNAGTSRILLDYADIMCYDEGSATPNTATWNGHTYPIITLANYTPEYVGHVSNTAGLRLAKAQWWMLARIAGWDGGASTVPVTGIMVTGAGGTTTITADSGTLQLNAAISPENTTNKTVTWSLVNGTGQASISSSGLATAIANGTVTARATANDGSGVIGTLLITISNQIIPVIVIPVTGILVTGAEGETTISTDNYTLQLSASVTPANATNQTVIWSMANGTGQATISSSGLTTAITNGTVTARATANDGSAIYDDFEIVISNQIVVNQIIADHTIVDRFDDIPAEYIEEVKKMLLATFGESHSSGYRSGLGSLEGIDPKFQCQESNPAEGYTTSYLRVTAMPWGDVKHETGWMMSYGEEDWFTSALAISRTKAGITYYNTHDLSLTALGFGWCYDTPYTDMTAYLSATQEYIDYCTTYGYSTKIYFTTGPVEGVNATGVLGYYKNLAYEDIRNYVNADSSRILFDYADILCYNDDGTTNSTTWNGHIYPIITTNNNTPVLVGHISYAGTVRLAKAEWWMLARIAGWDGGASTVPVTGIMVTGAGGTTTITADSGTLQLNAAISPENTTNKTVTWSLVNGTGQASISSSGLATAIANGTVTARATANDGSGVIGTLLITISNQIIPVIVIPVTGILVTGAEGETTISTDNYTLQLSASVTPANATNQTVIWSMANGTGQATISSSGLTTAITNGTVTARATANDGSAIYDDFEIVISNQIVVNQIIADHTIVDRFDDIPAEYIEEVKKMLLATFGESHSSGYRSGLGSLEGIDPKFQCQESNPAEGYTTSYLRVTAMPWGDVKHETGWMMSYGEEDWFTSALAISRTKAGITYYNTHDLSLTALGFGWCYDTPYTDMTAYLSATQEYIDYCTTYGYSTKIYFTTGPVEGVNATGVLGYYKNLAYEDIRNYVNADSSRILFDYADILCYNDDGTTNSTTWNGHIYPIITTNNNTPVLVGHISYAGTVRLAKAEWWMLARIAGWDGGITTTSLLKAGVIPYEDVSANPVEEEVVIYPNPTDANITVRWNSNHTSGLMLTIYNLVGNLVKTVQIKPQVNEAQVDLSNSQPGIYVLKLKDNMNGITINTSRIFKN